MSLTSAKKSTVKAFFDILILDILLILRVFYSLRFTIFWPFHFLSFYRRFFPVVHRITIITFSYSVSGIYKKLEFIEQFIRPMRIVEHSSFSKLDIRKSIVTENIDVSTVRLTTILNIIFYNYCFSMYRFSYHDKLNPDYYFVYF